MTTDVVIKHRPSFSTLEVELSPGQSIVAESDAMASMSSNVDIATRFNGGFFTALMRKIFGGESLFINEFKIDGTDNGSLVLTQPTPGDIEMVELHNTALYLQPGAFVACDPTVDLSLGWAGLASFVGGEGLFRLRVSGQGRVWIGGYGGIEQVEVKDEYIVDSSHMLAYEPTVRLGVGLAGGIFSSFFGGEGLVTRLRGRGRVYIQSRSMSGLTSWVNQHLH